MGPRFQPRPGALDPTSAGHPPEAGRFGWIADFRPGAAALHGYERAAEAAPEQRNLLAWASVVSLPRVLSLAEDGTLAIAPAPELEALRLNPRRQTGIRVPAGRDVTLRVFIDRSVVEVFANRRQCLTQRVYPTRPDSTAVRLFATGAAVHASAVEAWDMEPVTPW